MQAPELEAEEKLALPPAPGEAHWYCSLCDPDVSLCGFDISTFNDAPPQDATETGCVVCDQIKKCPTCGSVFA